MIYSDRVCQLGEGPLWLPEHQALAWFDILNKTLCLKGLHDTHHQSWVFADNVSAAGRVANHPNKLFIASETGFLLFDLRTGHSEKIAELESQNAVTRSNDGRADPYGGFWLGTMGKHTEAQAGSIYRYYRGEIKKIFTKLTIPNAICFSIDAKHAYFSDTQRQKLWSVKLDDAGWPISDPELFIDFSADNLNPDGAVVDQQDNLWVALWGAACVTRYSATGQYLSQVDLPASQVTCPAFGGKNLQTLFVTSASVGLSESVINQAGQTFALAKVTQGRTENEVVLQ